MRTVIFDLDGTLADTSHDLINAANMCFQRLGLGDLLDPVGDGATAMIGGGRAMLRLGFARADHPADEHTIDENFPHLVAAYAENIAEHTRLYPGTATAVARLVEAGYLVGICTNKPEALAHDLLRKLGVRDLFTSLIGADTLPVRKPDPRPLFEAIQRLDGKPDQAILVGDSPTDRETARAAGVRSLLVTFGPTGRDVQELQPDGLLSHYDFLSEEVSRLIG